MVSAEIQACFKYKEILQNHDEKKITFEPIYVIKICYVIDKMLPKIHIPNPFPF